MRAPPVRRLRLGATAAVSPAEVTCTLSYDPVSTGHRASIGARHSVRSRRNAPSYLARGAETVCPTAVNLIFNRW